MGDHYLEVLVRHRRAAEAGTTEGIGAPSDSASEYLAPEQVPQEWRDYALGDISDSPGRAESSGDGRRPRSHASAARPGQT